MTKDKVRSTEEALKLALEALEFNQADWQGKDRAITAIKQALNDATHLAAPDKLSYADEENPEYINGWNDCREWILKEMRK